MRTYFITGVTGPMASEVFFNLLEEGDQSQFFVLIRSENQQTANVRLEKLLRFLFPIEEEYKTHRAKVTALVGDVSLPKLGLSEKEWDKLASEVNYIMHGAALTNWGADLEDATKVNVNGVREVLKLAEAGRKQLKKLVHISTAYVSGKKTGAVSPNELDESCEVCDNYQLTKRQGEALMRARWHELPITIVRPGAVVGHSLNGRTLSYKTFYYPLALLYNGLTLLLPAAKTGHLEAVPSDWTAQIICLMLHESSTDGQCYHLTMGEKVLTNAEIRTTIYQSFATLNESPKPTFYIPYFFYRWFLAPLIRRKLPKGIEFDKNIELYRHYMTYKRCFDNRSTLELAKSKGVMLPEFAEYLPKLMQYAIENKWKARRETLAN